MAFVSPSLTDWLSSVTKSSGLSKSFGATQSSTTLIIPPIVPLAYNNEEGPLTISICSILFKSTSFKWSAPSPETSRFTIPFLRILTLGPDMPLIIGCPTAEP